MGRPPKLTPELIDAIAERIRAGVSLSAAGPLVGVHESTAREWHARGTQSGVKAVRRGRDDLHVAFAAAVTRARAEAQERKIKRIEAAGEGGAVVYRKTTTTTRKDGSEVTVTEERYAEPQWLADAWWLERTDPEHYGRKDRTEVNGQIKGGDTTTNVIVLGRLGPGQKLSDLNPRPEPKQITDGGADAVSDP